MKPLFSAIILLLLCSGLHAQTPTFSEDVAPIIFNKCTNCHRDGGIAPFTLKSYAEAFAWKTSILASVTSKQMPPWPPNKGYGNFMHERTLTQDEINTITDWVFDGAPEGDPNLTPDLPYFPEGKTLAGTPDLTITMPTYASQADGVDEYTCFAIPSGLTEDRFIKAIEVVPGNLAIVHHVIVFAADAGITDCLMPIIAGQTLVGYAPGAPPTVFPSNGDDFKLGMKLKAGSNIMLQIHYPEGTIGEWDSTAVNFYFYPEGETGIREVVSGPYVQNFLFPPIQPNTVQTIEGFYPYLPGTTTQEDMSILAVFPHMHLIGKSLESFAVDAAEDTIPMIKIDHWDFEWQGFYFYENLVKIPTGSRLLGSGIYDNTTSNNHNPSNPPQVVSVGEATTDEMFLISYLSLPYEPGDENYDLSDMMQMPVNIEDLAPPDENNVPVSAYPNPTTGAFEITGWNLPANAGETEIIVYNTLGEMIANYDELTQNNVPIRIKLDHPQSGIYLVTLKNESRYASEKIIVMQ